MNLLHVLEKFGLREQIETGLRHNLKWKQEKVEDVIPHLLTCIFTKHSTSAAYGYYYPLGSNRSVSLNHEISLHENLFEPQYKKDFISTLLHEVAHLISYRMLKKSGHCKEWKQIAIAIGDDGGRCAYYPGVIVKKYNYCYTCQTCGYEFKSQRLMKNMIRRRCKTCLKKPLGGYFTMVNMKTGKVTNYLELKQMGEDIAWEVEKSILDAFYNGAGLGKKKAA